VSLTRTVARRSMVGAHKCAAGCPGSLSRFATSIWMSVIGRKINVYFVTAPNKSSRPILYLIGQDLICLLLWECRPRIGSRFLSANAPFNSSLVQTFNDWKAYPDPLSVWFGSRSDLMTFLSVSQFFTAAVHRSSDYLL